MLLVLEISPDWSMFTVTSVYIQSYIQCSYIHCHSDVLSLATNLFGITKTTKSDSLYEHGGPANLPHTSSVSNHLSAALQAIKCWVASISDRLVLTPEK